MHTATLGSRRLYDALGVEMGTAGEVRHNIHLESGKVISVYLGPKPPMGVVSIEGSQFGVPGRKPIIFSANSEYEAPAFLEITVGVPKTITTKQFDLLRANDKCAREELLREAGRNAEASEHLLDAVSGVLGLLVHRQFVLKPLVESCFIAGNFEPVSTFAGPAVEMLEEITTNTNTGPHLRQLLDGMTSTPEDALRKGGATLHWLLRAWRERDAVSKFMYLFVPLEAVLQSDLELAAESKIELGALEDLVNSSNVSNKDALLAFLARTKTKFGPTLAARFEDFARRAAIPGWEVDVRAFKKFNRMRNLLLHAGDKRVRSHINLEENTRTLEDLVERYVSIALLGTSNVYQSRWRPVRA